MYEDFLPLVSKPARYINTEVNAVHKDPSGLRTKVCLLFPDTYEVGMSHLGLRILYDVLNKRDDTVCERVFSPWTDYEARLRAAGRPLRSLESNLPVKEFDIVGVTLQYELSYSNIVTALDLAGIPRRSIGRKDGDPIVVAGGPCGVNPGPLSDFIDCFFIGEAEEAVHELVDVKQQFPGRQAFLEAIAKRDGFYVPSLGKAKVRRRFLADIDAAPYPDKPMLPLMKPIHDRVTVEVARGCIRGCRFCQAGIIYRPYRERRQETVQDLLRNSLACTGYEELSLASLSSGDYSDIEPLVTDLMERYKDSRISVSLPSLRVGTLTPAMIRAIAGTRKTGFTLAPEAGTERLRRVINKPVSDLDLLDAAETIFKNGWSVLKLYFMIGLPTETDEDLDGIIGLANELLARGKRFSKRHVQLNVSVSTFVPKPHTPFQWLGQAAIGEIRRKQAYLDSRLRKRGIVLKLHDPKTSQLEAAFARGDASLGRVIEKAVDLGCRFDGWSESFDYGKWSEAFSACGFDLAASAARSFALDEELPWSVIRTGVTDAFLKKEYQQAMESATTGNCREECTHCGIGCPDGGTAGLGKPAVRQAPERAAPLTAEPRAGAPPELTTRIRMQFTRIGRVRFLSHLDLMTLFHRAAVRAGVPIAFSQGFNPHPKFSFGPALSVGMESEAEFLDMETDPFLDLLQTTRALNSSLPQGIRIVQSGIVPKKAPSLSGSISRYIYDVAVPAAQGTRLDERIQAFLELGAVIVEKDGNEKDIRPGIETIAVKGPGLIEIVIQDSEKAKPRIQDVVEKLFAAGREQSVLFGVKRTAMFVQEANAWKSPMEVKERGS
ncbi:MAG: TIGR03960 family B12-binding radical SAM protein [Nitrospirota bacterium]